jgi:hypothetical protein
MVLQVFLWVNIHPIPARTRPQISMCPSHFCDELIKKLETTKETSTVIPSSD